MQGNTFLEGEKKAQNGKPQPHAALYACIYLEYAEYSGLIYVLCFCYVLHNYIYMCVEYVEYCGMLYVVCIFCHGLHNFPFYTNNIKHSMVFQIFQICIYIYTGYASKN